MLICIDLTGNDSIIGRAVVCHKDNENLGKGGFDDSKTTSNAGARLSWGVIGISTPFDTFNTNFRIHFIISIIWAAF